MSESLPGEDCEGTVGGDMNFVIDLTKFETDPFTLRTHVHTIQRIINKSTKKFIICKKTLQRVV
jgi:hypothetical protein